MQKNDNIIPLSEYPRVNLKRDSYLCLNGLWDFKISKSEKIDQDFDLKIMVPYCVESKLSTINKQIEKDDFLLYKRNINVDKKFIKDKVILHLDGVDQVAKIYINKQYVYQTLINYLPNEIDITSFINEGLNEIIIVVKDDRNKIYPYGKQADKISGMWYSQVSGIFKTVWLESVSNDYIKELKITPSIDNKSVTFNITSISDSFKVFIYKDNKCIYKNHFKEKEFTIFLDEICEMPIEIQVTLLRVIQEGVVTRIGGKTQIPINVRIIAATNKNLKTDFFIKLIYYNCFY